MQLVPMASGRKPPVKAARGFSSPACYLHEFEPAAPADPDLQIKRIYELAAASDGYRALVDRLWPRGISKRRARLDDWLVELAPSSELRQWFHQAPRRWPQFAKRYRAELRARRAQLAELRAHALRQRVTLLHAARDASRNHAILLRDAIRHA